MLKLPKKEWLTRFAGTPLESISEWVRYYYIDPENYQYNDDGTIVKIDDVIADIDLGTLNYYVYTIEGQFYNQFYVVLSDSAGDNDRIYIEGYEIADGYFDMPDKSIYLRSDKVLFIRDTRYSTIFEIKAGLSGVYLIYAKA